MACGDRQQVTITEWGVCWKWIFPYPCRKTSVQTRFHYLFTSHRRRFAFFRRKFEGCCGETLFEWSEGFAIFGTGNGPWVHQPIEKFLKSTASSLGDCPFNPPPPVIR